MKPLFLAAAVLALSAPAALAKCGTNALNGTWHMKNVADNGLSVITVLGGSFIVQGGGSGTLTQTSGCKVTLVSQGDIWTGWSDYVPSGSSRKPRTIEVSNKDTGIVFLLIRK